MISTASTDFTWKKKLSNEKWFYANGRNGIYRHFSFDAQRPKSKLKYFFNFSLNFKVKRELYSFLMCCVRPSIMQNGRYRTYTLYANHVQEKIISTFLFLFCLRRKWTRTNERWMINVVILPLPQFFVVAISFSVSLLLLFFFSPVFIHLLIVF